MRAEGLTGTIRLSHAIGGAGPRQTSSGPAPAGTTAEAKGGRLPDPHRPTFLCVATSALPGSELEVRAKET